MSSGNRVLLIGLDGATWDLLDSWAAQGHLPTIEKLRRGGTWGPLRATLPTITPACWTSMYTGTNPGKHGIFGFFHRKEGGYRLTPVHSSIRKNKTMFQIASEAGLKVGVLNAPATYPPEPISGLFVPGIPCPEGAPDYTHPPGLAAELQAVTQGKHMMPPSLEQGAVDPDGFLEACDEYTRAVTDAAAFMMDRLGDWDFFMAQFQVTDDVQHVFWHQLDPEHPRYEPNAPDSLRNAVLNRYRVVDQCIDRLVRQAGEQTDVVVASDHGGGPFYEQLYVNIWLWRQGWLKFRRSPVTLLRRLAYALGFTPEFLRRYIYARMPHGARRIVRARTSRVLRLLDHSFLSLSDVDWRRTRAYSFGGPQGAIYVNLKGREPQGCVREDEYGAVVGQLERDAMAMRHPATGEPLVEKVIRSADLYQGPFTDHGPDLTLLTKGSKYYNQGFLQFLSKRWIGPPWNRASGHHRLEGMFLLAGPHVRADVKLEEANITDVAPTVLALLEQPIPDWMDGKPLTAGLRDEFLEQSQPKVVHDKSAPSQAATSAGYTAEDEAQIAKRLADLGYIE